jgi:hypothetical protein
MQPIQESLDGIHASQQVSEFCSAESINFVDGIPGCPDTI